jgi:CRP-like cAMP-binding protein
MPADALVFLTERDRQLLFGRARRQSYGRGQVVFTEGEEQPNLCVVRRGLVRVERQYDGQGIAVARYGPGDLLGEVAFLRRETARGSVIAEEEVELDVLAGKDVHELLAADAGLAARFYQSLALLLGTRLLQITPGIRLPEAFRSGAGARPRLPRTGQLSERQYPAELTRGVEAFRDALPKLAAALREGRLDPAAAQREVSKNCDDLAALLDRYTRNDALVAIGMEDLSAARDLADLARGVGGYVLLDTFRFFMRSATIELAFARPRGYAEDRDLLERIERNQPEGDGRLGPLIDRWFLDRPLCRARRNSVRRMTALLREAAAGPVRLTSLSAGTAREVFDLLDATAQPLYVTCLDGDPETLLANKALAEDRGCADRITFLQADLTAILHGQASVALGPQHMIYGLGVCDYLEDDEVRTLLDWAHDRLAPGGRLVLTNRDAASPDRAFAEHILDWPVIHRTPEEFAALFAGSRFGAAPPEVSREEAGVNLFARCRRP